MESTPLDKWLHWVLPERVELVLEGVAVEVEVCVFLVDHLENADVLEDLCLVELLLKP